MRRILAVMNDLFFGAQVIDGAKKAGAAVEIVKDRDAAIAGAKLGPSVIIIDLNFNAVNPIELIRELKSGAQTNGIRVVGFIAHVMTDRKAEAQQAGCDIVIARSAFAQRLPDILRGDD